MQRGLWRELHSGVKEDESIEYFGEEYCNRGEVGIVPRYVGFDARNIIGDYNNC